jgi:hypothetical protein
MSKKETRNKLATSHFETMVTSVIRACTFKTRTAASRQYEIQMFGRSAAELHDLLVDGAQVDAKKALKYVMSDMWREELKKVSKLGQAVVHFARHYGPWDSGNPDHVAGGDPEAVLYNEAVRACRSGVLPKELPEDWEPPL